MVQEMSGKVMTGGGGGGSGYRMSLQVMTEAGFDMWF